MKILQYCQHVLGIGHYFRTLEICRALSGHQVVLVSGGARIDVSLPDHIQEVRLPSLEMDTAFKSLLTEGMGNSVLEIKRERRKKLFKLYKQTAPDLFLVELYPFGRRAFSFEVNPILKGIRYNLLKPARIVCSLRDILVDRKKYTASYEAKVVSSLNRYFDALLIHADPALLRLEETFSRVKDITIPLVYTGFVTPAPPADARTQIRRHLGIGAEESLIVASLGGGRVGESLLEAAIKAFQQLKPAHKHYLAIFTGPLMKQQNFARLNAYSDKRITVARFTFDFLSYLAAADLSVSMAGYNTCMNILATGVPALVWPFAQNREQGLRAERLEAAGNLKVLSEEALNPRRLADIMVQVLAQPRRPNRNIALNGAAYTAEWLQHWMKHEKESGVGCRGAGLGIGN